MMDGDGKAFLNMLLGIFGEGSKENIEDAMRLLVDSGISGSLDEAGLVLGRAVRPMVGMRGDISKAATEAAVRLVRNEADLPLSLLLGGKLPRYEGDGLALSTWTALALSDAFGEYVAVNKDFSVESEPGLNEQARFVLGMEENVSRVAPPLLKRLEDPLSALGRGTGRSCGTFRRASAAGGNAWRPSASTARR